jgi:LIM domain kinase 1
LCLAPAGPPSNIFPNPPPPRQRILIISEFLPRGNLRSYIDDRSLPFPWRLRLSFAIDITRALAYLHARKCLHRDMKGENLLVTENERIKVCDFGFARIAARNDEEMRRMSYCGTDGYMSPEIIQGEPFDLPTDGAFGSCESRPALILFFVQSSPSASSSARFSPASSLMVRPLLYVS